MPNIAELSDEDFLSMGVPAAVEQQVAHLEETQNNGGDGTQTQETVTEEVQTTNTEEVVADTTTEGENGTVTETGKTQGQVEQPAGTATPPVKEEGAAGDDGTGTTGGSAAADATVEGGSTTEEVPDYKAEYEAILAPFTANGKEFKPKSRAEVVQLMQMGANYTRKMQELAPHRRVLTMLQDNKLTDEDTLSFLIDLKKGDKGAIQKLIKESGIDPRDIDVDSDSTYQVGNHRVSDAQVDFRSAVDDLSSTDEGKATIAEALKWDQASIDAVGNSPAVLRTIHEQRVSGVYDLISAEVNRQRVLGTIPASVPFLEAYRVIGGQMAQQEEAARAKAVVTPPVQEAVVVAKTVVQPKAPVTNGEKAKAAGQTRSTSTKAASTPINPLSLPDDEFMKHLAQFQGRV